MTHKRIWVSRLTEDTLGVGVDLIIDDNADRSKCTMKRASKLSFEDAVLYETDDKTAMYTITNEMATQLMDNLWKAGIRPTQVTEVNTV